MLITGATGFIGGYLLELFSFLNEKEPENNIQITALVRDPERFSERFPHLRGRADIDLLVGDLTESKALRYENSVDYIIHCASEASPHLYLKQPADTISTNTLGTLLLLEIARSHRARFLYLSSGAIYGQSEQEVFSEQDYGIVDPLDERACYSEGKRAGEAICMAYHRQYDLDIRIARVSHTYGPGLELNDGRVFTDFMADALAGRDICVKGSPSDARPFCYISDMVEGLLRILLSGDSGEAYNIGADSQITIAELAQLLCEISTHPISVRLPVQAISNPALRSSGYFNIEKIKGLGWECITSPKMGFAKMYRYYSTL
ncbi:nucleotide sugar dehydratase [Methylophaga thalassica]|uniref:Nucleotide sugar dehydratase n=1 Tax=Methylophaga thalassica TaxID=40223 RepID=A0ABQ5TYB6_9GAMM|nr:nucleotide sugar dehydratase [Methylophaga thalassica]